MSGAKFPEQARKMHYGETEHRSIYGEASPDEAKRLAEEGIEFHPLPVLPDERKNCRRGGSLVAICGSGYLRPANSQRIKPITGRIRITRIHNIFFRSVPRPAKSVTIAQMSSARMISPTIPLYSKPMRPPCEIDRVAA